MKVIYPATNSVSIWIGSVSDEDAFNVALDDVIEPRLNLEVSLDAISESTFEEPCSVSQLLEGFSGWDSFVESATLAATGLGIQTANSALVCYYLKCDEAPTRWGSMTFLGSFEGRDIK